MNEQHLVKAIAKLRPYSEFSFIDGDYLTIKWDKIDGDAPTVKEIEKAVASIKAEEELAMAQRLTDKTSVLERLGITEDEAKLLLS